MIAGANTDMLGRRWFLIVGQVICFIGHLIIGTSKTNAQIIVGMTIEGTGAALCQMAAFALPELLPNKWRAIGVVLADFVRQRYPPQALKNIADKTPRQSTSLLP